MWMCCIVYVCASSGHPNVYLHLSVGKVKEESIFPDNYDKKILSLPNQRIGFFFLISLLQELAHSRQSG